MAVGSGALYFKPDGTSVPVQLSTGHIVPPSAWTTLCAGLYQAGSSLEPYDVDDPGGVVFRDPPGGGGGVTYWRVETSSGVHRLRQVQAAGGGAGTGVNAGDWEWVVAAVYYSGKYAATEDLSALTVGNADLSNDVVRIGDVSETSTDKKMTAVEFRSLLLQGATSHADLAGAYGLVGLAWAAPATAGEEGHLTGAAAPGAVTNLDFEVRIPIPAGYVPADHSLSIIVVAAATPPPNVVTTVDLAKVTLDAGTTDLCTTAAQGVNPTRTTNTFSITDTSFDGEGSLNVFVRMTVDDTGGGGGSVGFIYKVYAKVA